MEVQFYWSLLMSFVCSNHLSNFIIRIAFSLIVFQSMDYWSYVELKSFHYNIHKCLSLWGRHMSSVLSHFNEFHYGNSSRGPSILTRNNMQLWELAYSLFTIISTGLYKEESKPEHSIEISTYLGWFLLQLTLWNNDALIHYKKWTPLHMDRRLVLGSSFF